MFRYTKKKNPEPAKFHEHTGLEIMWTVVPFLILVGMAIPASQTLKEIYNEEENVDMEIVVELEEHEHDDFEEEWDSSFSKRPSSRLLN